ncbi:MAG: alkaline phosphatase family protein [Chitinophagales bacterium]
MKIRALLSLLLLGQLVFASQNRKVLLLGIDGCRSDAFQQANTPNIDALLPNSLYCYDTWHVGITWSGPSWSSILTGVNWNKHLVTNNNFSSTNFVQYPPIATLAKQVNPNLNSSIVAEWDPLIDNITNGGWSRTIRTVDGSTYPTADSAVLELQNPDIDFLFTYFDAVDLAGHTTTFSPSNPFYINAIQKVDTAIGQVLTALQNRPTYANEDWLILIVTDHGGTSFFHGGNSNEERHIWWMASGSAVAHQQLSMQDPGSYNCGNNSVFDSTCVDVAKLKAAPAQNDAAVTALHHLIYTSGINPETKPEWNLDGKSWLLNPAGITENENELVRIYPNPASDKLIIEHAAEYSSVAVYDYNGRLVLQRAHTGNAVDVSTLPGGNYTLQLTSANGKVNKQFTVVR